MCSARSKLDEAPSLTQDGSQVLPQLTRILASQQFAQSPRSAAFLKFVVEEVLAGRANRIKARTIAVSVFGRDQADPNDGIVRIYAGRVRKRLDQYYRVGGVEDPIQICIPTGSYVPVFQRKQDESDRPEKSALGQLHDYRERMPRIAVLPFVNLAHTSQDDYFADGLGEEISAELARFQGLAVLAYWTTSQLQDQSHDLRRIGRDLEADFLVCGSIARSEDRIRLSIQCVQGDTGDQVWTERFDRSLTAGELFDVQDTIVQQVVSCIGDYYGSVSRSLFRASRDKHVSELSAYEAVLANHYYLRRLDQQTHDRTRAALEQAVDIEPSYALVQAMLGALYCDAHAWNLKSVDEPLACAEESARRAMALDQDCQHAHYASAYVGALTKDHSRIIAAVENIVRLNPHAAFMVGAASIWLGIAGQFDEAYPLLERSLELNPYHPGWFHFLPWLHGFTERDYERALAAALQFNMPMFLWDPLVRAATLGKLGREKEAASALHEVLDLQPDFASRAGFYLDCYVHADVTREEVLDGLRIAGLQIE